LSHRNGVTNTRCCR